MIPYEVVVSSVHDRADLLERTLRSMLSQVDQRPARILVHEDVRSSMPFVSGRTEEILSKIDTGYGVPILLVQTNPGTGLPRAMLRLLEAAATEFVFYTQEDFDFVRPVPVAACLDLMQRHALNSVIFNKRNTLPVKGQHIPDRARWWTKEEVRFDGQALCVAEHWRYQANMGRRALWLEGVKELVTANPAIGRIEHPFNGWLNQRYGEGCGSVDGSQARRRDLLRTFIWGPVGEPRFVLHTGAERRSQGWEDPEHDRKHGTVGGVKPSEDCPSCRRSSCEAFDYSRGLRPSPPLATRAVANATCDIEAQRLAGIEP